ncbi:MAG: serine/threonine-protein kinase, partial [Thermoanaerobaculia bacterium]
HVIGTTETATSADAREAEQVRSDLEGKALRGPPAPLSLEPEDIDLQYFLNLARAFAGVADGLQHAHSRAVVHRDIKPSNLILDHEGFLRILDFGLAHLEGQDSLTVTGDFLGTVLYMSPEQAMAKRILVDHRTDIYSLGATLYEMLTLSPPFQGKHHQDTLSQIICRDPVPLRRRNPRIPRDLETIVLKCLRKDPGDRYGTAEALAQDLQRFARGDPVEAQPQPVWEKLSRRAWRMRKTLGVVALVFLFLVTAAALFQTHLREARRRADEAYQQMVLQAVWDLEIGCRIGTGKGEYSSATQHPQRLLAILLPEEKGTYLNDVVRKLKQAVDGFPRRPAGRYHLARALFLLGEKEAAVENLDTALGA